MPGPATTVWCSLVRWAVAYGETARHPGHIDILRELSDAVTGTWHLGWRRSGSGYSGIWRDLPVPSRATPAGCGERRCEQQLGGRHRSNAARHWGHGTGYLAHPGTDITDEAAVASDTGAHINDDRAGPDMRGSDEARPPGCRDKHLGLPGNGGQVGSARMADSHRGVTGQQELGYRFADHGGATHDNGPAAGQLHVVEVE
jgi:hypothetical protein